MNVYVDLMVENGIQIKSGIMTNASMSLEIKKKNDACGKDYVFEIYFIKYIRRFIDDSAVKLDETIDTKKYIPTNFDERR